MYRVVCVCACVCLCVCTPLQVWVWSPVEMVKLRMQLQKVPRGSPGYVGPLALARRIWQREGVRGKERAAAHTVHETKRHL